MDNYSYFGVLISKGSDYVPFNSNPNKKNTETMDKMFNRMNYTPPSIDAKFNFNNQSTINTKFQSNPIDVYSQFGALRPKG